MNKNKRHKLLTNIYRIDHTQHRQLTLCLPQFAGGPLGSWGPRLKPT